MQSYKITTQNNIRLDSYGIISPLEYFMDEKITIIEGPPPAFETVEDGWALGLNEGPALYDLALTRVRTFNGNALVERCNKAWRDQNAIFLHYRNPVGLEERAPIMAARNVETNDGNVLLLWCRRKPEDIDEELDFGNDEDYHEDEP
jgi:hypothetical protein